MKLGSILILNKVITVGDLNDALFRQYNKKGGKIGTHFLALGLLKEKHLIDALEKQRGIRCLSSSELETLVTLNKELLPIHVIEQFHIMPVGENNNKIEIVSPIAYDLNFVSEIEKAINKGVVPYLAVELPFYRLIARIYNVEPPPPVAEAISAVAKLEIDIYSSDDDTAPIPLLAQEDDTVPISGLAPPPTTFSDFSLRLSRLEERDEIANLLTNYLLTMFKKVALFMVKKDSVTRWMGGGENFSRELFEKFSIDLNQPSIMFNLTKGGNFYIGPLPPLPAHYKLMQLWGEQKLPDQCVFLPIKIKERVVAIVFCCDYFKGDNIPLMLLEEIVKKTAVAFEICILKFKLKRSSST